MLRTGVTAVVGREDGDDGTAADGDTSDCSVGGTEGTGTWYDGEVPEGSDGPGGERTKGDDGDDVGGGGLARMEAEEPWCGDAARGLWSAASADAAAA